MTSSSRGALLLAWIRSDTLPPPQYSITIHSLSLSLQLPCDVFSRVQDAGVAQQVLKSGLCNHGNSRAAAMCGAVHTLSKPLTGSSCNKHHCC